MAINNTKDEIIFYNWPINKERKFRKAIKVMIDEGKTYKEIVNIIQEVFVTVILSRYRKYKHSTGKHQFFKRHKLHRATVNDWIKKYNDKYNVL